MNSKLLIIPWLLFFGYGHGNELSCYFCSSNEHGEGCLDPFKPGAAKIQYCVHHEVEMGEQELGSLDDMDSSLAEIGESVDSQSYSHSETHHKQKSKKKKNKSKSHSQANVSVGVGGKWHNVSVDSDHKKPKDQWGYGYNDDYNEYNVNPVVDEDGKADFVCAKVAFKKNDKMTVFRYCMTPLFQQVRFCAFVDGLVATEGAKNGFYHCSVCSTPLCNSGNVPFPHFFISCVAIIVIMLGNCSCRLYRVFFMTH